MSSSFVFDGRDFPPVIQRAVTRVMNPALDLTPAERVALAALVARAEAKDGRSAFWVRRINFGEMFARAERTISAWLAALEDKGWIAKQQDRTRWGSFQCLTVHLTQEAAAYLGLLVTSDLSTTFRKKAAGGYRNQGKQQSFGDTSPLGDGAVTAEDRRGGNAKVPADCACLLDLGLKPGEIFWLMGEARKRHKRLGEVVAVRADALRGARSPIAMLRGFLSDAVDYTAVLKHQKLDQELETARQIQGRAMEATKKAYAGATVMARNGQDRVRIWSDGAASLLGLQQGIWRDLGGIVGESLKSLWHWLEDESPPILLGA